LKKLIDDKILIPSEYPICNKYQLYTDHRNGYKLTFIGQHKNGRPNGIVRYIDEVGDFYEGYFK